MTTRDEGRLLDECPLVVEATDRETARNALHAMKRPGEHVGPFDVEALTVLLGRVREDERRRPTPPAEPEGERAAIDRENAAFQAGWEDAVETMYRLLGERFSRPTAGTKGDAK